MGQPQVGYTHQKVSEPDPFGERVARYVDEFFASNPGLSLGELAFRLRADKRDLQRLIRDRACGLRMVDSLAAYFGDDFVEEIFRPVIGQGRSRREQELERACAEIAARRERIHREREARRAERRAASGFPAV